LNRICEHSAKCLNIAAGGTDGYHWCLNSQIKVINFNV